MRENKSKLYKITAAGVFSAIVVVLQCTLGLITVGTVNLNFVLIPIIIAGYLYGPAVGTITGLAFGLTVFIQCITGAQGVFGSTLLNINWFYTFMLNVVRGALIGFVPAMLWRALSKVGNLYVRALIPALVTPVVNTGLFLIGYAVFFNGHMHELMNALGASVMSLLFITLAGLNFVFEFITSGVIIPPVATALVRYSASHSKPNE